MIRRFELHREEWEVQNALPPALYDFSEGTKVQKSVLLGSTLQ